MQVVSASEDIFLNCKFFFDIDVSSEVSIISRNEVATTALCSCILDDNRTVNVVRVFKDLRHCTTACHQPFSLFCTAAFPSKDASVTKGWYFEIPEILAAEVFNKRSMRDNNHVLFPEPFGIIEHFSVIFEHQPFIRLCTWEGFVEATTVLANCNTECTEALHPCTMQDLE